MPDTSFDEIVINTRPENFPTINEYRNPLIASAMKTMGYVKPTITGNPNSPNQRYTLTEKGKELMNTYEV